MKQKLIFVGLGKRGEKCWLKLVLENEDLEIDSIVVPRLEREKELKAEYPILNNSKWFRNLESCLENTDADFAVVTSPPQVHYEQIKALLNRNIDVLSEKPLVMNIEDAITLAEISKSTGSKLWIGQNFRYSETSQYLNNIVTNNTLGKAEMANILYLRNRDGREDWLNKYPLEMEHPMLFEQSEHHFDLIRYCYNQEVGKVYGHTMNPSWSMYKHQATVNNIFEMKEGLLLNYFGTWSASHGYFDFQWRTDFKEGIILQKSLFGDMYKGSPESEDFIEVKLKDEELFISDTRILFEKFVNREALSIEESIPDIFDNLYTLALIFATLESDNIGKSIYMDDYNKKVGIEDILK